MVAEAKVEGAALGTYGFSIEENQALTGVAFGLPRDQHKLPFSLYLAILFKVHRMSLLILQSAPFDPLVRGVLVQGRATYGRVSLSRIPALLQEGLPDSGGYPVSY